MLFDLDTQREITHMPHEEDYRRWRQNLSDDDHTAIREALHVYIDDKEYFCASFIPGPDWTDTPYQPIYTACGDNWDQAKLFFGQLVWEAVQQHDANWSCKRFDYNRDRIMGLTYFRIHLPM